MSRTHRNRLVRAAALAAALLAAAGSSAAKDLCLHTTADGGYTFVLKKASEKTGAFGTVSGYAVLDGANDYFTPIDASFFSTGTGLAVGITRYATSAQVNSNAGSSYSTVFHNIGDEGDRAWKMNSNGTITILPVATVTIVDCATVPAPPR